MIIFYFLILGGIKIILEESDSFCSYSPRKELKTQADPVLLFKIYIKDTFHLASIHIFLRKINVPNTFRSFSSSNSPLLTYLLRIHTHETNVPRTPKIHIPQSYRSRARNYQSRTENGELSRGNQSQLSARLPRRFHHFGSHRRTEREIVRERERRRRSSRVVHIARSSQQREAERARNRLETIRKPIRATIRGNGWRLERIRGRVKAEPRRFTARHASWP